MANMWRGEVLIFSPRFLASSMSLVASSTVREKGFCE